ncbi:MAG: sigma 54-interacting transcriptional regulator [Syntrophobacteraceae bacterium]
MNNVPNLYNQLCTLLDHFLIGVITVSPESRIVSVNKSAETIAGCKESEILGRYCRETFLRDICGGECRLPDTINREGSEQGSGRRTKHPKAGKTDSESFAGWLESRSITKVISPLYDSGNGRRGCAIIFQDHSVLKDLIERVRHEDRRLKIVLDNLDIGILTVDRGGHITFFNSMAETITGFTREDILGMRFSKIFGRDLSKEVSLIKQTISDGEPRSNEEGEIVTREGRKVPVRTHYIALKHEDGRILGGLITISDLSLKYQLNSAINERYTFYDIVGKDPAMQKIFDIIPVIAASDSTVLITGPTGTGKDLLAKVIHNISNRSGKPMVTVNCAALPDNLLESEMFGYVKGAFTGADRDKPGRFQEAEGGTIFLDEIGELPLSLQAKLLHVLEDRAFYPLGSRKAAKVDVRIIAATNQEMEKQVKEKRFRGDLYYRLNVINLKLPELKERRADLPLLIYHVLNRLCVQRKSKMLKISEEAMEALLCYDYPGNVRELENILEYAVIVCRGAAIELKHLPADVVKYTLYEPPALPKATPAAPKAPKTGRQESDEKERILTALRKCNWNRGETAKMLNMDRATLWRKMKKYELF